MAIAAAYQTTVTFSTTTALWTAPSSTSATFGAYARDLVITNSGTVSAFFSCGTGVSSSATTSSFVCPAGGSIILTQCAVPASVIVYGATQGGVAGGSASIGYATNVAYI